MEKTEEEKSTDNTVEESEGVNENVDNQSLAMGSKNVGCGIGMGESIKEILFQENEKKKKRLEGLSEDELSAIVPKTDISDPNRRICVVTTAAMPWRTGTAVNPLLRALYLTRGRPPKYVTLVIPWVKNKQSRIDLYGKDSSFQTQQEQEQWIRSFCRERANCKQEEQNLKIIFYEAEYRAFFGSIFATVDICSLIPHHEADVVILEEPEHLNWFRVPSKPQPSEKQKEDPTAEQDQLSTTSTNPTNKQQEPDQQLLKQKLGWAHKFRHSVGILHTNYSAYMRQYGVGTSLVAAPALDTLSSIVVRSYCHRVIRLSAVLPSLAKYKEVTCNVHGVRSEFLNPSPQQTLEDSDKQEQNEDKEKPTFAPVYFIGKIIWAKGFDKVLALQDLYRKHTGDYFPIDIYGGGSDQLAISRAFLGRHPNQDENDKQKLSEKEPSKADEEAAQLFNSQQSLRERLSQHVPEPTAFEVTRSQSGNHEAITQETLAVNDHETQPSPPKTKGKPRTGPLLSIVADISGKSVATGLATTQAIFHLADSVVKAGINMTFTEKSEKQSEGEEKREKEGEGDTTTKGVFFDPPKSRFELRRHPIPAKFKGVLDHAKVRDIKDHKIFLNMSTTEVLCTTTAEALAMGKFVIIPNHPSNEFFLQFPNCLAYTSQKECVEKLKFALAADPEPLSDEDRHKFTWEGANERLFEAAKMTKREELEQADHDASDTKVCKIHVETAKRGHFITHLLSHHARHHNNDQGSDKSKKEELNNK